MWKKAALFGLAPSHLDSIIRMLQDSLTYNSNSLISMIKDNSGEVI